MIVKIFIVEDDKVFCSLSAETLRLQDNYDVTCYEDGSSCLEKMFNNPDIVVIDYRLPDMTGLELMKKIKKYNEDIKVIIVSAQSDLGVVVNSYNLGAAHYIMKNENSQPELLNAVRNLASAVILKKELEELRSKLIDREKYTKIIGNSEAIRDILKLTQKAEKSDILVLITGESGTGKELVARAIHYHSKRKNNAFIPVNMSAIPADLIESELFGHEKGSFTGAIARRIGKFEEANFGTIFLDEIGEMDLSLQSKILRILEDQMVVRVGSNKSINLDLRIIAASNKNLADEVNKGKFREDLYYRLQGFLIDIPPLRERNEDIILLAKYFLNEFIARNQLEKISLEPSAINALLSYHFPGNVRELKSMVERAALVTDSNVITATVLNQNQTKSIITSDGEGLSMEQYKMKVVTSYLEKYNNDIDLVARKLKIGRATIYRMLKKT